MDSRDKAGPEGAGEPGHDGVWIDTLQSRGGPWVGTVDSNKELGAGRLRLTKTSSLFNIDNIA